MAVTIAAVASTATAAPVHACVAFITERHCGNLTLAIEFTTKAVKAKTLKLKSKR
jgi:hypothetical protein